jgi:hypothetical protein
LYLNNGTTNPFAGVGGVELTGAAQNTRAVAAADFDRDGLIDVVVGNETQTNRLYPRRLYDTSADAAVSLGVDDTLAEITNATFMATTTTMPPQTALAFFLSNNGGTNFFPVRSGVAFVFPTGGNDLRWRAELRSHTPVRTPRIHSLAFTAASPIFAWRTLYFSPADLADPSKEATLWGDEADPDGDGQNNFFEFTAGLLPTDGNSRFDFRVEPVPGQPAHRRLVFSPRFAERSYTVEFTSQVGLVPFVPLTNGVVSDNGLERTVTDVNAGASNRFYRVSIVLTP